MEAVAIIAVGAGIVSVLIGVVSPAQQQAWFGLAGLALLFAIAAATLRVGDLLREIVNRRR